MPAMTAADGPNMSVRPEEIQRWLQSPNLRADLEMNFRDLRNYGLDEHNGFYDGE